MVDMASLRMPVDLPLWGLASLKSTRSELRGTLGKPHFVETDPRKTCGGEEDAWAFTLPSGQRLLIILDPVVGWAELFADPPDLESVLEVLNLSPDDSRLARHAEPWLLK